MKENRDGTLTINNTQTLTSRSSTGWTYKDKEICEPPPDLDACAGYINSIMVNGKKYKLQCEIVEVHPLTCTKCGAPLELHNGHGTCKYCGTSYSAVMNIVEDKEEK